MASRIDSRGDIQGFLEDLFKNAIRNAYINHPNVDKAVRKLKVQPSNIADYQINCWGIASDVDLKENPTQVANQIKNEIQESSGLIEKIETENGFINIFINDSGPKKCSCRIKTNVGEQEFNFSTNTNMLYSNLIENLSQRFLEGDMALKRRLESNTSDVILQNFKVHMGGDFDLTDIERAVQEVADRDIPELNSPKIPPIFILKLFLSTLPQAIDMDLYPRELERQKKELESQTDMTQAKELKAIKNIQEKLRNAPEERKAGLAQNALRQIENHNNFKNYEMEFTVEHKELLRKLKLINQLDGKIKKVNGDRAEKKAYNFLKDLIKDEEVVVINNFKIMTLQDLEKIAADKEKDFVIFNLTKRYIMSLEVKSSCNESSLISSRKQVSSCLDIFSKWCGSDLSTENGWKFFSVIFFEENSENFQFCDKCKRFIIIGNEFKEKFLAIINDISDPSEESEVESRKEFKRVVKYLLFLASYEPVITPRLITQEVVKIVEKAGTEENILLWNNLFCKMFCWTPIQLSFLKDQTLRNMIFLSPPSCGKTVLKKAKVKYLGQERGEDVVFLVPCFKGIQALLFHHLKREFGSLNVQYIKVDTVKFHFGIDEEDLLDKINNRYRNHHVFIDEVAVANDKDISLLKKVADQLAKQSRLFWVSITYFSTQDFEDKLISELQGEFNIVKNELNIPLRNTLEVIRAAHNKGKTQTPYLLSVRDLGVTVISRPNYPLIMDHSDIT